MSRLISGALLLIAAVGPTEAQSYLPLESGHRWVFSQTEDVKAAVVKTRREGTAELVCIEQTKGKGDGFVLGWKNQAKRVIVSSTDDTITVHSHTDDLFLLPANFANPEASTKRVRVGTVTVENYTIGAAETVKTPAGSFKAVPVSAVVKTPATSVTVRVWYARGVGPVKLIEVIKAPPTSVTRTLLLESYSFAEGGAAPQAEEPVEAPDPVEAPEVEAPEVERPTKPAAAGAAISIADLVAQGAQADLGPLLRMVGQVKASVLGASGEAVNGTIPTKGGLQAKGKDFTVLDELHHARVSCSGLTVVGELRHSLVVCDGDVTIAGEVKHSVIIASGTITLAGELKHSLTISKGDVQVSGDMDHGTTVSHGTISVSGDAKYMVLECTRVVAAGDVERSVLMNTPLVPGKRNQAKTSSPTLRELSPLK